MHEIFSRRRCKLLDRLKNCAVCKTISKVLMTFLSDKSVSNLAVLNLREADLFVHKFVEKITRLDGGNRDGSQASSLLFWLLVLGCPTVKEFQSFNLGEDLRLFC